MKKQLLFFMVIFCSTLAVAQSRDDTLLRNDEYFNVDSVINSSWLDESAVILAQKTVVIIEKEEYGKVYTENWVTRTKILLQDKAAVEYWSDFTTSTHDYFEMKIHKKNGELVEIDTNQFIPVSEGFAYSSFDINESYDRVDYKKLAIEQLEIGDIIDYTYQTIDINYAESYVSYFPLRRENTWNNFLSYTYAFGSNYPKIKQAFVLKLDPTLYFTVRGVNGLNDPEEESLKNGMTQLTFNVEMLERFEAGYFTNGEITNPKAKIEVAYAEPNRFYRTPLIIGKQGENSNGINKDALKRALFMDFHESSIEVLADISTRASDPVQALNELYAEMQKYVYDGESADYNPGSYYTAFNLYHHLSKKFEPELLVCLPNTNGSLDELAITTDVIFAVRVKTKEGGYHYAYNSYKYSAINDWDSRLVGTRAYAFKPTKRFKDFKLIEVELPDYTPEMNQFYVNTKIALDLEQGVSNFEALTRLTGALRSDYIGDIVNINEYGYDMDFDLLNIKLSRFYSRLIEKGEAAREQYMKNWVEDDFNVTDYKSFELKSTGFEADNNTLEYIESYEVDDLFKLAGSKENQVIVVDAGRIITSQIALLEKDRNRKTDIIVDFQKQYHYDITIQIPEGYTVRNKDELEYRIETDAGRFIATAEILEEDGVKLLKVTSIKSYTNKYLPKEKWNEMEGFLDAAYEFSQQKVVLEKEQN